MVGMSPGWEGCAMSLRGSSSLGLQQPTRSEKVRDLAPFLRPLSRS